MLMHTYTRYQIVLDHGEGVYLYDTDGKKYLDFMAGIAVFALGYGNEAYNAALKEQIEKVIHTSNLFYHVPMVEAAEKFLKASGMDRVFFTNSGTEAIEGAIKLARKYAYAKSKCENDKTKVPFEIISMNHSFHGRSTGALAVTGNPGYQKAFMPLMDGIVFADFNDLESVKARINKNTCAVLLETVQGEGGIYPASEEFMSGIRSLCDENGLLMICDEIQCGMGRTGTMFAYEQYGIRPDIITSAKALGCGVPVGAFAAVEEVASALVPGDHGTTYGGNPLALAAVSKVFDLFEQKHLCSHVNAISAYLKSELDRVMQCHDYITAHRGMGLMRGLEFQVPVKPIIDNALKKGLVLISAGANIIRFVPPLIIKKEHVDEMIYILEDCLKEI